MVAALLLRWHVLALLGNCLFGCLLGRAVFEKILVLVLMHGSVESANRMTKEAGLAEPRVR